MATQDSKKNNSIYGHQDKNKFSRRQFVQASIVLAATSQGLAACDDDSDPPVSEMNAGAAPES